MKKSTVEAKSNNVGGFTNPPIAISEEESSAFSQETQMRSEICERNYPRITRRNAFFGGGMFLAASLAGAQNKRTPDADQIEENLVTGKLPNDVDNVPPGSHPINTATYIPVQRENLVNICSRVVLSVPGRPVDLQMRVAVPLIRKRFDPYERREVGGDLPVILFSHGHGTSNWVSSLRGYSPLIDFYASHGFVVIQPTHLDSTTLGLDPNGPEGALFWRSRAKDMHFILDHLVEIEAAVPGLEGRLDRNRISAVGHSLGGHTVALLAGMRVIDPNTDRKVNLSDSRVKFGVMLAPPGSGTDLAPSAVQNFPILRYPDFSQMTTPALITAGDHDINPEFSPRVGYRSDAYYLSPGPKSLLTLFGGEHSQGGVSGYDVAETTDENPERVGVVQRLTWAYLRTSLYPEDRAWPKAMAALMDRPQPIARIDSK